MFLLGEYASSLAGAVLVIGLALCLLPLLDRNDWRARSILLAICALLAWRYVLWRFAETLPPLAFSLDGIAAYSFALLEAATVLSSTCAFLILARTHDRGQEASSHQGWWLPGPPPLVDLYIATYNEEQEVLERTIAGATAIEYPNLKIFVLDDGRRPWLAALCRRYGVGYRTRPDNAHAKAGNMNYALHARLADPDPPDFVAVLDADFVPHRNFVSRVLALFHEPRVGLVQTPQHFFNPDPIQHNLGIAVGYPDEQRFFFDQVEPARDCWGIAICCGTSSIVRGTALVEIGGFPTDSVTEDYLLTLRLSEHGWRTVYLNEPLTEGLAPEGLQEYIVQRSRWCLGLIQIARSVYNPFGKSGLNFLYRFSLIDSFLYWATTFPFRLASLLCPLLYWYFGIIVVNASVPDICAYFLPYYAMVLATLNWISRGRVVPLLNDVSQLIAAWPVTRAVAVGLVSKGPQRFRVTAKGGDRSRIVVQWPIMRPFAILFGVTAGALILPFVFDSEFNYGGSAEDGMTVVLFWTVYNLFVLAVTMAACVEQPRHNRPQRYSAEPAEIITGTHRITAWVTELGADHARLRGPAGLATGERVRVGITGIGKIAANVISETTDGYEVQLRPSAAQRGELLRRLHTRETLPGFGRTNFGEIVRQWGRGLVKR